MARGARFIAACIAALTLAACAGAPPVPAPTSHASATSSPSATSLPSSTPTATTSPSPSVTAPPADPEPERVVGVTATPGGGSGEVLLRWTQNSESDIAYYIVLRALSSGGALTVIGTVTPAEVTEFEFVPFVDSDATVGYYRVRAVDAAGQKGPMSTEVCAASFGHSC